MIGISRTVAAEFTFFLAIPVMFGASLLKVLKFGFAFTGMELACLLVGTVISFIVSLFVLRFLMGYIKSMILKSSDGTGSYLVLSYYCTSLYSHNS